MQLGNAYSQGEIMKGQGAIAEAQAEFQAAQMEVNARFLEIQSKDILDQGDKDSAEYGKKISQFAGSQRAALAAQGIAVDSDTALELQRETAEIGALDASTIKNNAWRQAFGYKQEAISAKLSAKMTRAGGAFAKDQAGFSARNTLVAGGLSAINTGLQNSDKIQSFYNKNFGG